MPISTHHQLGALQLPRGMVWIDEYNWSAVEQSHIHSTTGALLVDVGVKQAGRPITLAGSDSAGWITRAVLDALRALTDLPGQSHQLTLADGRVFAVMFAPGDPLQARPVARPELPPDSHPYVATLKLIEI